MKINRLSDKAMDNLMGLSRKLDLRPDLVIEKILTDEQVMEAMSHYERECNYKEKSVQKSG